MKRMTKKNVVGIGRNSMMTKENLDNDRPKGDLYYNQGKRLEPQGFRAESKIYQEEIGRQVRGFQV
eukprot:CAMPEP_0197358590 /NCGR_PEP_ID=MMETSP0893-20130614/55762_1 /TAXON_ID=44058 ORGANISM="Aureoumbra lagunensis, Strain CCMP1510" /NCGR_SAMPLE_ID=MMETSP0893 /ASSEMBLY_ACC=CAM_ASM_000539 /LENGTH=65 /DNA_ID=CAMNT_0042878063 /DNA_START=1 /DNA_END=198 /DNA_ORIENTATION=-